jgi:hypothetical protein
MSPTGTGYPSGWHTEINSRNGRGYLRVTLVPNQTARHAAYQVEARTGQAAHAYVGPIVPVTGSPSKMC